MSVLIIYERKNRELENAVILKTELEKRGYTTDIRQFYDVRDLYNFRKKKYKVIFSPHLYETKSIPRIFSRFGKTENIINLQYEQVLSKKWEDLGKHNPRDEAKKGIHICWGETTKERLKKAGINQENLRVLGALHLDLLRDNYRNDSKDKRNNYLSSFKLNNDKKLALFISSFTYADISKERLSMNEEVAKTKLDGFVTIHTKSRDAILEWFEEALISNPNKIIIYRPHPDELSLDKVTKLEQKYSNFKIIMDGAVKNWIESCDIIYSWYSTSVVESHFLKKPYSILRPYTLSDEFDSVLLKKAETIKTKEKFIEDYNLSSEDRFYPIKEEEITKYYCVDKNRPSFKLYADLVDELVRNGNVQKYNISIHEKVRAKLITFSVFGMYSLYKILPINLNKYRNKKNNNFFINWFIEMDNQFPKKNEIENLEKRIKEIVDEYKEIK